MRKVPTFRSDDFVDIARRARTVAVKLGETRALQRAFIRQLAMTHGLGLLEDHAERAISIGKHAELTDALGDTSASSVFFYLIERSIGEGAYRAAQQNALDCVRDQKLRSLARV